MTERRDEPVLEARVRTTLLRCAEWSHAGLHRRVLGEVRGLLPWATHHPEVEAQLQLWKAQSLLAMGHPERALPAAARSWELEASPHACHLMANALSSLGSADDAEDLLRMGWSLFPEAPNLPIQLAMMLSDQGRLPEALETLDDVEPEGVPEELQVFLLGLRANLMAALGRWHDARDVLDTALTDHPDSTMLDETSRAIEHSYNRQRAERALVESWLAEIEPLTGIAHEIDEAIIRCGAVTERSPLVVLAARRLLRSFSTAHPVRVQAPDPWAAAMVLAVMELDGMDPSASAMARAFACSASTVRASLRRVRRFIAALELRIARRSFSALVNPRLDEPPGGGVPQPSTPCSLIPFPNRGASADTL
jgi:hypothetical protein